MAVVAHEQVWDEAGDLPVRDALGRQQDLGVGSVMLHGEGDSLAVHLRLHGYKNAHHIRFLACGEPMRERFARKIDHG